VTASAAAAGGALWRPPAHAMPQPDRRLSEFDPFRSFSPSCKAWAIEAEADIQTAAFRTHETGIPCLDALCDQELPRENESTDTDVACE
jgi:hypothetical protein